MKPGPNLSIFIALASALLTILASPGWSQDERASAFESWHVTATSGVAAAVPDPNSDRVAVVLRVQRKLLVEDTGSAWAELHLSEGPLSANNATGLRPFITGKVNVGNVQWTPHGTISFTAKRDGDEHTSLYDIRPDGGEARRLISPDSAMLAYDWSKDGKQIVYLAREKQSDEEEKQEKRGFDAIIYEEDNPFTRVFLQPLDDRQEAVGDPEQIEIEGSARAVSFSPSADRLMVTVTPTPLIDDSYTRIKIHVIDLASREQRVIDNPGKLGQVVWSPNGTRLAMISAADLNDPAAGRLMVASVAGGEPSDALPDFEAHATSVGWLDDQTLVYTADIGSEAEVGTTRVGSEQRTTLLPPGQKTFSHVEVGHQGRLTLVGDSPTHPNEAFALDTGGSASDNDLIRLSDSNPWLDDLRFARQEVIRYQARDGLELEGVLIYPLDYEQGQRYPLLMVVHGGPEANYPNGWLTGYSTFGQVAAARGFALFYPNYRGSTGRGVEFSKLSQADASGPEFDDYIDGIDHLIEIGLVDKDKVGITGASYGGYASAWATTYYSARFAAAAPFVGISNNISKVGTTDIPQEMYDVHHRKWLWEDFEYFKKSSPIFWVKRNRTPTLISHGEDDPRVHPSQSLELFRHLKVLDQAPVRLVLYPGEGHGNAKSASRFDYHLRVLRWMEHYLKGPGGDPPPYEIDHEQFVPWADEADEANDDEKKEGKEA